MTVSWHLRGFDKLTDFVAAEFEIPEAMLPAVRLLLPEAGEDPDFIDPQEITPAQVTRLAALLGLTIDPDLHNWSVESEEDPYVVAARVDAVRAKA